MNGRNFTVPELEELTEDDRLFARAQVAISEAKLLCEQIRQWRIDCDRLELTRIEAFANAPSPSAMMH